MTDKALPGLGGEVTAIEERTIIATMEESMGMTLSNIQSRLDHPGGPVTDKLQRNRMTVEMLSGAAFAYLSVGHPLAPIFIKLATQAAQVGEEALKKASANIGDTVGNA